MQRNSSPKAEADARPLAHRAGRATTGRLHSDPLRTQHGDDSGPSGPPGRSNPNPIRSRPKGGLAGNVPRRTTRSVEADGLPPRRADDSTPAGFAVGSPHLARSPPDARPVA